MNEVALVKKLRLFLSSPGDVEPERAKVRAVAEQVNQMLGESLGVVLEVVDWKTHVVPDMGRPQEVINQQVGDYDIFVGILWKRFGTPTGKAESGTEEEFNIAYENWQKYGRPRILFYFSQVAYVPKHYTEAMQWAKVMAFKEQLQQKGLIRDYESLEEFSDLLREQLSRTLQEWFRAEETKPIKKDLTPFKEKLQKKGLVGKDQEMEEFADFLGEHLSTIIQEWFKTKEYNSIKKQLKPNKKEIEPFWGKCIIKEEEKCFVLMPFNCKLTDIYERYIKQPIEAQTELKCIRADDIYMPTEIMRDIWKGITTSKVIIADLSTRNANVFYELGLAHALGKNVILISQSMDDVPFDLRGVRVIIYEDNLPGYDSLRETILKFVKYYV